MQRFLAPFFMQHFQIRIVALDTPVTGMLHGVRGLDYRFVQNLTSDDPHYDPLTLTDNI